jgi:ABC-type transporter Mla maintaining outer membrane lipid asymmetry ATPase subunit MlaF
MKQNDPIKADLIQDMVVSISKIPIEFNEKSIFKNVLKLDISRAGVNCALSAVGSEKTLLKWAGNKSKSIRR